MKPVQIQLVALTALLAACSGEGPTTTTIIAAEGGSVVTATHDITIPPASLPMDTEVTLDMADPSGFPTVPGDRSVILRVEPEGGSRPLTAGTLDRRNRRTANLKQERSRLRNEVKRSGLQS